jgi:hypothetical protein
MKFILPKSLCPEVKIDMPLFFLAGPVRGGGDWQNRAVELISKRKDDCYIVNPWRYPEEHWTHSLATEGGDNHFHSQTMWERHYLEIASRLGCILFWLGCEDIRNPRSKEDGPYARETYGEIGRWSVRLANDHNLRVVFGADPNFPGLKQIKANIVADTDGSYSRFPTTLKATVRMALDKCKT